MSVEEYNQMLINEGIAKGKELGIAERDAEHVKNMALRGFTESDIAIALGMSEDEVKELEAEAAGTTAAGATSSGPSGAGEQFGSLGAAFDDAFGSVEWQPGEAETK